MTAAPSDRARPTSSRLTVEPADLPAAQEPIDGRPGDGQGRDEDEAALETARKELDLLVAVGVIAVDGTGGVEQGEEGDQRRGQVDQRLRRVAEQADRAGQPPRRRLQPHGQDGGQD
jgi:hypothetical protein